MIFSVVGTTNAIQTFFFQIIQSILNNILKINRLVDLSNGNLYGQNF